MTVLFNPAIIVFAAATLAGSGQVVRGTYTTPAGKRAEVVSSFVEIDASAAAANTCVAFVRVTIGGTIGRILLIGNNAVLAGPLSDSYAPTNIPLNAGDTVEIITINNAAVNVTMVLSAIIREFL